MIPPRKETEDLLLLITESSETPIKHTHTEPQETVEFKLTQPREKLSLEPPTSIERCWMLGSTRLELYISILIITGEKCELYTNNFDEFSFAELRDELKEFLGFSDLTPTHLQHDRVGPRIIKAYEKLRWENLNTDGYFILLLGCACSTFQDFESYRRIVVGLDEKNFQLLLKQYNFYFLPMKDLQAFNQLKIIQRLFAPAVIMNGPHKKKKMILA